MSIILLHTRSNLLHHLLLRRLQEKTDDEGDDGEGSQAVPDMAELSGSTHRPRSRAGQYAYSGLTDSIAKVRGWLPSGAASRFIRVLRS